MVGRRGLKPVRVAAAAFLLLCGVYLAWPVAALQTRSGPGDGVVTLTLALSPGHEVTVGFVHSFYKVVQEERYVFRDGKLLLSSVYFGSFDALNYYDPLGVLPRRKIEGGYEVEIDPPSLQPIRFAIGHSTRMWLKVGEGGPIDLERFAHEYDNFSLHVAQLPRAAAWFAELTHG